MRLGGLACIAAVAGLALQPPQEPQPPQPPTFRAEANLVRVDVTVVDRRGEPVGTLTADDFAVEEDGVPQTVQSFKFVSADGQRPPGDSDALAIRSPEHAAAEAARDDVRVFVIFWDDYHINRFISAIQGRKALTDFVTSAFGPTDLIALMDPLLPMDALRFTRDRGDLAVRIRKLEGRFGEYMPVRSVLEEAQLGRDVERLRSEVTLSAMTSAAAHLGSLKEGRKTIILVSEGIPALGRDQSLLVQKMTDTANNNNVAIYTLDPRGLTGGYADVLRTIAGNTGGEAIVNTNTPATALRQVIKDASAFYLLGYASLRNPTDGKFHKISVRVKRPGVDVRARKGYWAPSLTEVEHARTEAAVADRKPADVTSAMAALSAPRADRMLDVWIGTARGVDRQSEVTVAWTPRPRPGQTPGRGWTVSVTSRAAGGTRVFDSPLETGRVAFTAPPGSLRLDVTMKDADGNALDEEARSIAVPDLSGAGLALSSPVVLRARNLAEARTIAATPDAAPFAAREFVRTDRLFVRFVVYAAAQAIASAHLLSRAGAPLAELAVTARPGIEGGYQIDLPLSSTARGDYLLAVEAVDGAQKARALVPLRVVP